jgi:hypothetical protein
MCGEKDTISPVHIHLEHISQKCIITACKNTHVAWVAGGRVLISTPEGFNSNATMLPSERQEAKIFAIPGFHVNSKTDVSGLVESRTSVTRTMS